MDRTGIFSEMIAMIVKQLKFGGDNFIYLLGCETTRKACVIDTLASTDRIIHTARQNNLTIEQIIHTHGHYDHVAGSEELKKRTGAKIIMHELDAKRVDYVDIRLKDEKEIIVGDLKLRAIHTPGHTPGGICLYAEGQLFTGDTLFVGDSGRTDLPGGHRPTLGASIRKLMTLPDETIVWPGHDYGPTSSSTIGWEKKNNVNAKEYGFFIES